MVCEQQTAASTLDRLRERSCFASFEFDIEPSVLAKRDNGLMAACFLIMDR